MAEDDPDTDDEWFKEVYGKQYTGPACTLPRGAVPASKRSLPDDSDDEDAPRDPNAVPTDFTSREAKVWEAKAKAMERNWKRRKEEELHCKLCGEAGHFAQGCPTTLGTNRKSGEVVERLPLKDKKRLKPRLIGTGGSVIQGLEKDTGCRLRLEDGHTGCQGAFTVRISGPDRATVSKAVHIVKKLVSQVEDEWKCQSSRKSLKTNLSSELERVRGCQQQIPKESPVRQVDPLSPSGGRRKARYQESRSSPETLEELERVFLQEALDLSEEQSAAEEREHSRHLECLRDIHEQYQQKMNNLTSKQARQREDFHQEGSLNQHATYEYAAHHSRKQISAYGSRNSEAGRHL